MAKRKTKHGIPIAYTMAGQEAKGETTEEVLRNGGLDYEIQMEPLFDSMGQKLQGKNIPTMRTFRSDTNQTLGAVTPKYHILQNYEMYAIADQLCDMDYMKWDRIGERNNGQEVWGSFKLNEGFNIKGVDWLDQYIYLHNANDGNGGLRITPMNIRPMCTNQYAHMASQIRAAGINLRDLTVRHSSRMDDRIKAAVNGLKIVDSLNENFVVMAEEMMEVSLDLKQREDFYVENLGLTTKEKLADKNNRLGLTTRGMNTLTNVFEVEKHANNSNIAGTAWGTFNSLTQFIDHNSILNQSGEVLASRVDSALFGTASRRKSKAFDSLIEMIA